MSGRLLGVEPSQGQESIKDRVPGTLKLSRYFSFEYVTNA
jgi:hypothetical protein